MEKGGFLIKSREKLISVVIIVIFLRENTGGVSD